MESFSPPEKSVLWVAAFSSIWRPYTRNSLPPCARRWKPTVAALHIDATGEDGRGTLVTAWAGWRGWVLSAWKAPTERTEFILPGIQRVAAEFGAPCAILRDLGRAMTEAAAQYVQSLKKPIPVLACHQHFLSDIGKDLLEAGHH